MPPAMQPYRYRPLDRASNEMRLVRLLPGNLEDNLKIEVFHASFDPSPAVSFDKDSLVRIERSLPDGWQVFQTLGGRLIYSDLASASPATWQHPSLKNDDTRPAGDIQSCDATSCSKSGFEALSYTWGTATVRSELALVTPFVGSVESSQDISFFKLQPNLHNALRFLRYDSKVRTIWIDAICINQEDLQERSEQVMRMADIYRCADRVVVWLGLPRDESALALRTLQYIGEQVQVTKEMAAMAAPEAVDPLLFRGDYIIPIGTSASMAVSKFLRRHWFNRLWIRQEIQLANPQAILHCGSDQIDWSILRYAIITLYEKHVRPDALRKVTFELVGNLAWCHKGHDLSRLLLSTATAQNLEPRDRIYALLGLTEATFSRSIQPDYRISVKDVYESAIVAYLRYHGDLRILGHSSWDGEASEWPSWVPRLQGERLSLAAESLILYSAVHPVSFQYSKPGVLDLNGLHCAKVTHAQRERGGTVSTIRSWFSLLESTASQNSAKHLFDAYLQTLVLGNIGQTTLLFQTRAITIENCRRFYLEGDDSAVKTPIHNMISRCIEGQSFILGKGFMGLGPASAQPGDHICMLLGSTHPVVLRTQPSGEHKFLGVCYIHGLMDSEALLGPLPPGFVRRWHILPTNKNEHVPVYTHPNAPNHAYIDPRLNRKSLEWGYVGEDDCVINTPKYQHRDTGEISSYHPEVHRKSLEARGLKFQTFRLS